MEVVCGRRKLKKNVNKSKVMKVSKSGKYEVLNVLSFDGGIKAAWVRRLGEDRWTAGTLKDVWERRKETTGANMDIYNGIVVLSILFGCETLEIYAGLRKKLNVLEICYLRSIRGVTV